MSQRNHQVQGCTTLVERVASIQNGSAKNLMRSVFDENNFCYAP